MRKFYQYIWTLILASPLLAGCAREPMLYLHQEGKDATLDLPNIDVELKAIWDYKLEYDVVYDWQAAWKYKWDATDVELFGKLGYNEPEAFEIRRYFTGDTPNGPHSAPYKHTIYGKDLTANYEFGYWDILAWNYIDTPDGIQSVRIDESSSYDEVVAHTGETMMAAPHYSTRFTRSFYQPEEIFAGYEKAIEINKQLDGFTFDADRNCWVKKLDMVLQPMTYIYLLQVILHHNNRNGRIITAIDGNANLSGMARSVTLNTGVTGSDAITVNFNMRMKKDLDVDGEKVDIIGGKVLTFGIPKINPSRLDTRAYTESLKEVRAADLNNRHYFDVTMQFNNGKDSTFVFDVTSQVRKLFRGGVITVELDMDTIPVPNRTGGSGFDAVVKDYEEKEWEFDM